MTKTETKGVTWRRRLLGWGWQLGLALLLMLTLEAYLTRAAVGQVAAPIEGATIDGQPFSLQQLRGGAAVVHFWASWCPVCELEQGMVADLAGEVPLISVAMQSGSAAEVREYLQRQGVAYPVVNDAQGILAAAYGVKAVPASFVVDRAGTIRFATRGYTSGWGMRIRVWLAGLF